MNFKMVSQDGDGTQMDLLLTMPAVNFSDQGGTSFLQNNFGIYHAMNIRLDPSEQTKRKDNVYFQPLNRTFVPDLLTSPVQMFFNSGDKDHYNLITAFSVESNGLQIIYLDDYPTDIVYVDLIFCFHLIG